MEEEKFLAVNKNEFESKQVLVECVINLENGEQIDKVLSLSADAFITSVEVLDKEGKISGEIYTSVLFQTPDGLVGTIASVSSFHETFKNDTLAPQQKVNGEAKIVSITPTSVSESSFKILVTAEIQLIYVGNTKVDVYSNEEEGFCSKFGQIETSILTDDIIVDIKPEIKVTVKENINKILIVDSNAIIKELTAGAGFVSVTGEINTYLVYIKEEGVLATSQTSDTFKEEIEVANASKESLIEIWAKVRKSELKAIVDNNENITITTPIALNLKVYGKQEIPVSTDIYSLKNELELVKTQITNVKPLSPKFFEGKIEGNLTLSENDLRIDKILALSAPRLTLSNYYVNDGEVNLDGIVQANVIYLNDTENIVSSVEIEVPFVVSEKIPEENGLIKLTAQAVLSDCDILAKRGKEIYFDCKIKAYVNLWTEENFEVISGATVGRGYPEKDASIEIFFARSGNTFWDIAKELKITQDVLVSQNPTLTDPLIADEKVVVYYGID